MTYDFEKTYDVAVVGAGIAGVAAAVQAARRGKRTILIEKTVLPGGLATNGLVYVYLPLCDGNGHQVSFGITDELLRMSIKYGPGDIPAGWENGINAPEEQRLRVIFSPAAYMLALDEFMVQNNVDIWYDTLVCDAIRENGKVTAAIVENESGRGRINAGCFVDASGSCILARRAGLACHDEYNFLSIWAVQYDAAQKNTFFGDAVNMKVLGYPWEPEKVPPEALYRGIDGKSVTRFILESRKMLLKSYLEAYQADPAKNRSNLYALKVPAMPQFRKIYSLDAAYVLDSGENNKHFDDSIGMCGDWRKAGPVWEIPYRSLYPADHTSGILAAGRCSGAKNDAWEVTRVIPVAGLTGQAAGMAAALSVEQGVNPCDLDPELLQAELRKAGFKLHLNEVGL